MFVSPTHFRRSLLVPLAALAGCIGMRTPLTDSSTTDSSDATQVACGNTTMTIDTTPAQPDILILLDRSDSMNWSLTADSSCAARATNCSARSTAVISAIGSIVTNNPKINWGLALLPSSDTSCSVSSTPQVGISASSASAIKSQLAAFTTSLSTPTAAAINAATAYLKKVNDSRNKAILLATDGLPNCGSGQDWTLDDMTGAISAATAAKKAGFPVYVVGMGPDVSNMNSTAVAGGTGSYYPATSTTALNTALQSIAKAASLTCTFKANTIPPDRDLVNVYVDKNLVVKDDNNGWTFDANDSTYSTIVLTGTYCQAMMAGSTSQVQIIFGCPESSSSGS
jgi:hypothetical protein